MTARNVKRQVVLDRMSPADDPVYFDSSTPPSVCYGHEDGDGHLTRWWITPEDYTAFGEPEQITVTVEPGDRTEALADFVSDFQMQRHLDNEPCSSCGGDRLRPDFVTAGRCHVPATTEGATP